MNNRNEKIKKFAQTTAITMLCTTALDLMAPKANASDQNHDNPVSTNASTSSTYTSSDPTAAPQLNNNDDNGNVESSNSSSASTTTASQGSSVPSEASSSNTNDDTNSSSNDSGDSSNVSNDFNVAVSFVSNQQVVGTNTFTVSDGQNISLSPNVPGGYQLVNNDSINITAHKGQSNIAIPVSLITSDQNNANDDNIYYPQNHGDDSTNPNTDMDNHTANDDANNLTFPKPPKAPQSHPTTDKKKKQKAPHIKRQYRHPVKMPAQVITPRTPHRINHHRIKHTNVHNPMLRPWHNPDRIHSVKDFKSQVHINMKHVPKNLHRIHGYHNFDKTVLRYRPILRKITRHYHMRRYDDLLLAIMEVESQGKGKDVMQSSESAGLKPGSLNTSQSIEQAVRYLRSITDKAKAMDRVEHHDKRISPDDYHHYAQDNRLLAQSYDYGGGFLDYVAHSKYGYNEAMSERYSKDVVAKQLGNRDDKTYSYRSPVAEMYHKDTLYQNGGNYLYADEVSQHLMTGYMHQIMQNLIQYRGRPYVFGGKTPQTDFDCSGLVSYGFKTIGFDNFPDFTETQWNATKPVKNWNQAQPGNLIFFKGTYGDKNFISHVGFLVDKHTMLDSNSRGVEFTDLDQPYWKQHFAGIHYVPYSHQLDKMALLKSDDGQ